MDLTKEHFDKTISGLATKIDLKASKSDLKGMEERILSRIDDAQEELAIMAANGFEDIQRRLDVSDKINTFERKFEKLAKSLNIKL